MSAVHVAMALASSPPASAGLRWILLVVLGGVFVAILFPALLLTGAFRKRDPGRDLEAHLDRHYAPRHSPQVAGGNGPEAGNASATVAWVTQRIGADAERQLAQRLDLAGIKRKPGEWIVIGVSVSLLLIAVLTAITGTILVGLPLGALLGWLGMRMALNIGISRRRAAFSEQLPDVFQLLAGSLQSGFSLPQALDAVVRENTQPAASEFSRALAETRLGGDVEDALERVAERMDSTDLRWAVMAVRIQRSVGGNLVEVLRNTVDMMRERASLRRQVRALSAEGRLSAYILIALPLLVGSWLFLSKGSYMRPLYTTPLGLVMLIVGSVLMVLGTVWMSKVIKVEV